MIDYKPAIYYVLIANFCIVIGAGHGIGVLGLIEISYFPYINQEGFTLNLNAVYESRFPAAALFSLLGNLLLLCSLWVRIPWRKCLVRLAAIVLMWVGFIYVSYGFTDNSVAQISFITGVPFLLLSVGLAVQTIVAYYKTGRQPEEDVMP